MKKILIANRGEIVARIARTCKRLNIATVAVYSNADSGQAFISQCDESVCIGGSRAEESYLNIDAILGAAKDSGADGIHPGYGFLSENAEFASRVADEGIVFIGPSENVLLEGGEKDKARALAEKLKIPCVPGLDARGIEEKAIVKQAETIGFPLLVKAAGGGGGRGMRRVDSIDDLPAALSAAEREATAFFGNPHLLLEKLVCPARHIEVQVVGDSHGTVLHFFERDCSIQRKFQKIIEESPARDVPPETRSALHAAAITIARELELCGAATVEFLYSPADDVFYFLEINPRLQVEHCVTEEVCDVDLVELQIIVARGEALPIGQSEISLTGHAIEARVYAEIPQRDFMPSLGVLSSVAFPELSDTRFDHALAKGCEVSPHYDSMLVKIIGVGAHFEDALNKLHEALSGTAILGVETNIPFLLDILDEPLSPPPATSFLATFASEDIRGKNGLQSIAIAYRVTEFGLLKPLQSEDPFYANTLFRHTHDYKHVVTKDDFQPLLITSGTFSSNKTTEAVISHAHVIDENTIIGTCRAEGEDIEFSARINSLDNTLTLDVEGQVFRFFSPVEHLDSFGRCSLRTRYRGHHLLVEQAPPIEADVAQSLSLENKLLAPLPGTIAKIAVRSGQRCQVGETLIILESMKTEHVLCAPRDLEVHAVRVEAGETVQQNTLLIEYEAA